jgi:hypothetical protein
VPGRPEGLHYIGMKNAVSDRGTFGARLEIALAICDGVPQIDYRCEPSH